MRRRFKDMLLVFWLVERFIRLHIRWSSAMHARLPRVVRPLSAILDRCLLFYYCIYLVSPSVRVWALSITHPVCMLLGGKGTTIGSVICRHKDPEMMQYAQYLFRFVRWRPVPMRYAGKLKTVLTRIGKRAPRSAKVKCIDREGYLRGPRTDLTTLQDIRAKYQTRCATMTPIGGGHPFVLVNKTEILRIVRSPVIRRIDDQRLSGEPGGGELRRLLGEAGGSVYGDQSIRRPASTTAAAARARVSPSSSPSTPRGRSCRPRTWRVTTIRENCSRSAARCSPTSPSPTCASG
jgi:hypothetical protein